MTNNPSTQVVVIGGGFSGLSAAYELARAGVAVTVLEAEADIGGLAAAFEVQGEKLDRFYHHWFTNDLAIMGLVADLGQQDRVEINPTNTAVYHANQFFRLSTPLDLLRFKPLALVDRIRLGLLALRARRVKDWRALEGLSAEEWLRSLGGDNVYRVVWEPLLLGKFGPVAREISAVWFWNKLKLRGGSRGKGGEERLAYYRGGFVALAQALVDGIRAHGGQVLPNAPVRSFQPMGTGWQVETPSATWRADHVIATPALPLVADMVAGWADDAYLASLRRIHYLANVCLVLELDRPLSGVYWLNVNDPDFPFVGVIEHTNFARAESYGGRHIVYLSKYLPYTDALYAMDTDELFAFALPHLQRMFPALQRDWVLRHHVWKARWAQPVVERHYSRLIPPEAGPLPGLHLCSMAQIYPEDRGTNYAVREGRRLGRQLAERLAGAPAVSAAVAGRVPVAG